MRSWTRLPPLSKRARQRENRKTREAEQARSKTKSKPKARGSKFNEAMRTQATKDKLHLDLGGGKKVCYQFQRGQCTNSKCAFVHQCAGCRGPKGYDECPNCSR